MRPEDQSVAGTSRSLAEKGGPAERFEMKACETRAEREGAFNLVYQCYRKAGLMAAHPMQMRVLKQHLLDTTDLFVAKRQEDVCFTVTLIRDSASGLPAESLFGGQIEKMRSEGVRLAEVSCVASRSDMGGKREQFNRLVRMLSLTVQTARRRGVDRLLLAVHPRHAKVYQRLFGCTACTEVRQYELVQGHPAVLCTHDFAELDTKRYPLYDQMYQPPFEPWQLDGTRITAAEIAYFAQALAPKEAAVVPMAA